MYRLFKFSRIYPRFSLNWNNEEYFVASRPGISVLAKTLSPASGNFREVFRLMYRLSSGSAETIRRKMKRVGVRFLNCVSSKIMLRVALTVKYNSGLGNSCFVSRFYAGFLTAEAVLVIAFTSPPPPTHPPLQFRKKLF